MLASVDGNFLEKTRAAFGKENAAAYVLGLPIELERRMIEWLPRGHRPARALRHLSEKLARRRIPEEVKARNAVTEDKRRRHDRVFVVEPRQHESRGEVVREPGKVTIGELMDRRDISRLEEHCVVAARSPAGRWADEATDGRRVSRSDRDGPVAASFWHLRNGIALDARFRGGRRGAEKANQLSP